MGGTYLVTKGAVWCLVSHTSTVEWVVGYQTCANWLCSKKHPVSPKQVFLAFFLLTTFSKVFYSDFVFLFQIGFWRKFFFFQFFHFSLILFPIFFFKYFFFVKKIHFQKIHFKNIFKSAPSKNTFQNYLKVLSQKIHF